MKTRRSIAIAAVAAAMAVCFHTSPASAALDAAAISCRAAVAKSYSKLVGTAAKTVAACHKARDANDPAFSGIDCNALATDAAHVDPKHKFSNAATKHVATVDGSCTGLDSVLTSAGNGSSPQFFVSCPVACPGVANPIVTMHDVGLCQGCEAAALVDDVGAATFGSPTPGSLSDAEQKCHASIAKYSKYLATALKAQISCQGAADNAGSESQTGCIGSDPKSKVSGALTKASEAVDKVCAPLPTVANLDGCSAVSAAALETCSAAAWQTAQGDGFHSTYQLDPTICPNALRSTIHASCSADGTSAGTCSTGFASATRQYYGWKGYGDTTTFPDEFTLATSVSCPGSTKGSCGTCSINGLDAGSAETTDNIRCVDDSSIPCSPAFGTDPACPLTHQCAYFLSPPTAISVGNTPLCLATTLRTDVSGDLDPDSGDSNILLNLRTRVYLGALQQRPCPICRNDSTPQDGVKGGICLGGSSNGAACDVDAFDFTYTSSSPAALHDGPSLDCPPDVGTSIAGNGPSFSVPLTTGTSTLTATDACDPPNAGYLCACGSCSHDPTIACQTDNECDLLDDATINGSSDCSQSGGFARLPNPCSDLTCDAVPGQSDRGVCGGMSPDMVSACDGLLTADGHGLLECIDGGTCASYTTGSPDPADWICPGDNCGACVPEGPRACFVDPISATGTPDVQSPILAAAFCVPTSANVAINSLLGLPGPSEFKMETSAQLRY